MPTNTLPLSPIEADFEEKLQETVDQYADVEQFINETVDAGLKNVYFVGAGGSLIASFPAFYLLHRMVDLPVYQIQSDELNFGRPKALGPGSLVILASYTGTTKETVAAAEYAKEAGATVFSVCKENSPLAKASTKAITGASDILELVAAYCLCARFGVELDYEQVKAAFAAIPKAFLTAVENYEPKVHDMAVSLKDEPITYVLGSGPSHGWAYGLAMCYLQEMQWKHAVSFNAGEFFQGAFEVVVDDTPVVLLLGEDASRPIAERAQRFLDQYTRKAHYIDAKKFDLPGIDPNCREIVSPLAISRVIGRLAAHYEAVRGHALSQRRYMFRTVY
ncbi:MAG: SIS domain-containing protein [Propionibacteriaceae bacterium]|jgi:fructoselysine-6-P-deglycase FrlB-like protein|nr:SIS domain-containing protein [Propionibacteriaceae bacterium]